AKLIRGLRSEAPAGFRSRRGDGHDRTPVAPQNAAFPTYKAPRVHHAPRRRGGGVAARGARAAADDAGDRMPSPRIVRCFCGSLACLKDAGFIEGENVAIEYRWASSRSAACVGG